MFLAWIYYEGQDIMIVDQHMHLVKETVEAFAIDCWNKEFPDYPLPTRDVANDFFDNLDNAALTYWEAAG